MSTQLTLSACLSALAMALFALAGGSVAAEDGGFGLTQLGMMASACTPPSLAELLPVLQPGLQ